LAGHKNAAQTSNLHVVARGERHMEIESENREILMRLIQSILCIMISCRSDIFGDISEKLTIFKLCNDELRQHCFQSLLISPKASFLPK
jgi:hypothetical protein